MTLCDGPELAERPRRTAPSRQTSFAVEERNDHTDGLLGLFLHDPMARIGDHGAPDIARDGGKLGLHGCAVRVIAADREHGHGQLADLCKQRLVILCIPGEGRELSTEGVVDRARTGIERRIMVAGRVVDPSGLTDSSL
jgi:hypothetical protein